MTNGQRFPKEFVYLLNSKVETGTGGKGGNLRSEQGLLVGKHVKS